MPSFILQRLHVLGALHVAEIHWCPRGLPLVAPHEHFAGDVHVAGEYVKSWVCVPSRAASAAVNIVCSVPHTIAVITAEYFAPDVEEGIFVFISRDVGILGNTLGS